MTKNKKVLTLITTLAAVALLMTGTFAWQQMVSKVNEFIGHKTGVTVHDDFDPKVGKKDVYVENTGSAELFVRVKLNEAMNLGSYTWRPGVGDWIAHTCGISAVDCGHTNTAGQPFHSYFTWEMGGQKYFVPTDGSTPVVQDTKEYTGSDPGAVLTPNAEIIEVTDYLSKTDEQRAAFIGWIYDTDGYAYWSRPLEEGGATGLLLHKVYTNSSLKDTNYYYAIDVIVEAVDIEDIPMWTLGAASVDGSGRNYPQATVNGITVVNSVTALAADSELSDAQGSISAAPVQPAIPEQLENAELEEELGELNPDSVTNSEDQEVKQEDVSTGPEALPEDGAQIENSTGQEQGSEEPDAGSETVLEEGESASLEDPAESELA